MNVAEVLDQWSDFSEEEESGISEESEDSSSDESEKEEEGGWAKVGGEECYISAHEYLYLDACIKLDKNK